MEHSSSESTTRGRIARIAVAGLVVIGATAGLGIGAASADEREDRATQGRNIRAEQTTTADRFGPPSDGDAPGWEFTLRPR